LRDSATRRAQATMGTVLGDNTHPSVI
jgi:hypothetical protein